MRSLAPVRFLGEERFSFQNEEQKTVNMMKVVMQSVESLTDIFTFNIIDEETCNMFANLSPMSEGYGVFEIKTNKKGFIDVKLKGWQAKKQAVGAK